jgi:hypothetical protein
MKAGEPVLVHHLDIQDFPAKLNAPQFTSATGILDLLRYLPEVTYQDHKLNGFINCMMTFGDKFHYLPSSPDDLYTALSILEQVGGIQLACASFLLSSSQEKKEELKKNIQNQINDFLKTMESLLGQTNTYLIGSSVSVADLAAFSLYTASVSNNEINEMICSKMDSIKTIKDFISRQVEDFVPIFIKYGYYTTCYASAPYSTIYQLMMTKALLPFKIIQNDVPCLQVFNKKIYDFDLMLITTGTLLKMVHSFGQLQMIKKINCLLKANNVTKEENAKIMHELDDYYKTKDAKELSLTERGNLEDIYSIAIAQTYEEEVKNNYKNLHKYTTEYSKRFSRKEHAILLACEWVSIISPPGLEEMVRWASRDPFDKVDLLKQMGYKTVNLILLNLAHYKDDIAAIQKTKESIENNLDVYNFCDGFEDVIDQSVGPSICGCLRDQRVPSVSTSEEFYKITNYKHVQKEYYVKAGVPTSPFVVMTRWDNGEAITKNSVPFPVLIKLSADWDAQHLPRDSKCHTIEELEHAIKRRNSLWPGSTYNVESFIDGREFTVLVSGNHNAEVNAYTPLEYVFPKKLKEEDKWICGINDFDRVRVEDKDLGAELMRIAKAAYTSTYGMCYARVDLRQSKESGKIYVLETNSIAGMGYGRIGETILNQDGLTVKDFFQLLNFHSKCANCFLTQ